MTQNFIWKNKRPNVLPEILNSEKIKRIVIEGNYLQDISSITQHQYPSLLAFEIFADKRITEIILPNAPSLQKIRLDKNKYATIKNIKCLRPNMYKNLKYLQISRMRLSQIPIIQAENLQILKLSKNSIQMKQNEILLFPKLKHLDLSYNQISKLSNLKAPQLIHCDLQNNILEDFNILKKWEYQLKNLEFLNYSQNYSDKLPQIMLNSLKNLMWRGTGCQKNLTLSIFQLQYLYANLFQISLACLGIEEVPLIKCRDKLKYLNLVGNQISYFKSQQFLSLKQLLLSYNLLTAFPQIEIPQIQILQIQANKIVSIPRLNTPKIKQLKTDLNLISDISQFALGFYPQLRILDFPINKIRYFPKLNTPTLRKLDLSHNNQLRSIQEFASIEYPQLKELHIKNNYKKNQLGQIHQFVLPMLKTPQLQILDAENIHLSDISSFFKGIYPQLRNLILSDDTIIFNIPQIHAPKLQNVNFGKVQEIVEFLKGDYQFLKTFKYTKQKSFILQTPDNSTYPMEQVNFGNNNQIIIKKMPFIIEKSLKNHLLSLISHICIDEQMTQNTQFLSYLNFNNVKKLQINNLSRLKLMKNLAKVNLNRLKGLKQFQICQSGIWAQAMIKSNDGKKLTYIEKDQRQWRRMYIKSQVIEWRFYIKYGQNKCINNIIYGSQKFTSMLNGTRMRTITRNT